MTRQSVHVSVDGHDISDEVLGFAIEPLRFPEDTEILPGVKSCGPLTVTGEWAHGEEVPVTYADSSGLTLEVSILVARKTKKAYFKAARGQRLGPRERQRLLRMWRRGFMVKAIIPGTLISVSALPVTPQETR